MQLLTTKVSADVVVPYPEFHRTNFDRLVRQVATDARNGRIPTDERSLVKTLVSRMVGDVDKYLRPAGGSDRVVKAETTALCTGWWVTADGYMVTGAHCVAPESKVTAAAFAEQAREELEDENQVLVKALLRGVDADDELKDKTEELITRFNTNNLKLDNLDNETNVLLAQPGGGVDNSRTQLVEIVAKGESYPGKDVAILKVSGQQNLPTLELGADNEVQVGSSLYIDGFPGTVTNEESLTPSSRLQPTFTQGPYNAQRTTQKGVPYFQTQAPAYGGNSGGPVLSDSGRVVGILIAALGDSDGNPAQNEQLVLPVSVVKEKLAEKSIQALPSTTTVSYNAALDLFYKRHYKKALPKFREVQNLSPDHPYVAKYIADSQTAITAGNDRTPMATGRKVAIGGGIGAAVLLLVGLILGAVMLSRRRRTRLAGPPMPPWPPYLGPPGPLGPPRPPGPPGPIGPLHYNPPPRDMRPMQPPPPRPPSEPPDEGGDGWPGPR